MSSSSKIKKAERFAALVQRAGPVPISIMATREELDYEVPVAEREMPSTAAIRVAKLMVGSMPPAQSPRDAERINRVATQLHELKLLAQQQVSQRHKGHG
jgi:hypothetical protein